MRVARAASSPRRRKTTAGEAGVRERLAADATVDAAPRARRGGPCVVRRLRARRRAARRGARAARAPSDIAAPTPRCRTGMAASPGTELVDTVRPSGIARRASRSVERGDSRRSRSFNRGSSPACACWRPAGREAADTRRVGIRARGRDARMRAELLSAARAGTVRARVDGAGALLDEFDGIEIAAAAVQLLERERARSARRPRPAAGGDRAHGERSAMPARWYAFS